MADIIIDVEAFQCQEPIVKDTFRVGNGYLFNWSSIWDDYVAMGINATIDLWYSWDGGNQNVHYSGTSLPLPGNADMYLIPYTVDSGADGDLPGHDQMDFRLVFSVEPDGCTFTYNIPYSQIQFPN